MSVKPVGCRPVSSAPLCHMLHCVQPSYLNTFLPVLLSNQSSQAYQLCRQPLAPPRQHGTSGSLPDVGASCRRLHVALVVIHDVYCSNPATTCRCEKRRVSEALHSCGEAKIWMSAKESFPHLASIHWQTTHLNRQCTWEGSVRGKMSFLRCLSQALSTLPKSLMVHSPEARA